ncbi:hypothetical protein [Laspinema sp. D2d]|nr:hypothetical protein [Laspinema sp. D2d]
MLNGLEIICKLGLRLLRQQLWSGKLLWRSPKIREQLHFYRV